MDLKTGQSAGALDPTPAPQTADAAAGQPAERDAPAPPERPTVLVDADQRMRLDLRDFWTYRELLYFLTWRVIKVRYKQTLMGAAWVIVQPLATMVLFTLFFNRFAGVRSGPMPYPLFAYTGLLLWTFFSGGVVNGTNSLINNTNLITKVYFPRAFIPAAAVAAGLVDLAVASVILVGLAVYYGVSLTWGVLLLPLFIALTLLLALGVGLLVSALTVKYRDLRHALPFLIQLWMFASPVIYPSSVVPQGWRWLLVANPLAPVVEGFRAALVGAGQNWTAVGTATLITLLLLVVSLFVFRRVEETFADVV
ncbi:MAG TPA: ABC transporter permease [Pyrinomonadaceae bacterium]|nr:ABC transporter permease [Pyrinomonadaceae bacterium]